MKSDTQPATDAGSRLWQGLEDYLETPEFKAALADEFPEDAAEWADPVTRRRFLSLSAASLALAGAAGCGVRPAPQRKILPYARQPDQMVPGVPLMFASVAPFAGYARGITVRSNEGRPTKIEGNPDHPASLGGTDLFAQASILDLYDPDRSARVLYRGEATTYEAAVSALKVELERLKARKGAGLRIVTEPVTSPTLAALMTDGITRPGANGEERLGGLLRDLPEARWVQYDTTGGDNAREGAKLAFGKPVSVHYDFTKADVVLALDSDFLCDGPAGPRYSRDFASRRKVRVHAEDGGTPDRMNRLYAVEPMPTGVGSKADHRLALPAGQVESFARALAGKVGVANAPAPGELPADAAAWLDPLAKDLNRTKGKCVVVVGAHQPASLHALGYAINAALGNVGQTVIVTAPVEARPDGKVDDFKKLVADLNAGTVETILLLGVNPAYTAPANTKEKSFAEALAGVKFKFHLGSHIDETSVLCDWHVPEAHFLETWGDARAFDGTAAVQQPLIAPLNGGKSPTEIVADATGAAVREGLDLVRAYWQGWFNGKKKDGAGAFEEFWQKGLRNGVLEGTAAAREASAAVSGNLSQGAAPGGAAPAAGEFEINFRLDPTLLDGRFANNGWLQELPKPVTKLSWDNAVFVSPKTAKALKVTKEYRWTGGERGRVEVSVVSLSYQGKTIKAPVWILPAHADNAITVHLGHGRDRAGWKVVYPGPDPVSFGGAEPNAEGKMVRGFNANALRTPDAPWFGNGAKAVVTPEVYRLACVQANYAMGEVDPTTGRVMDRKPVRNGTLVDYKADPKFAKVPPAGAAETDLIDKNVPGPKTGNPNGDPESGVQGRYPAVAHEEHKPTDGKKGGHEGHDHRMFPLVMVEPNDSLYPGMRKGQERRWAMAFDLTACTGCNACAVACVSENNTPVVGKFEVTRGHDMYWIRVDRYYAADLPRETDPAEIPASEYRTHFQPVNCQQCEKAPCEVVCPVGATVHSADGLNDMAYNRCVGTRYCSNNCPYKVRRFNFLTFQDWATESLKLGRNPDVSVRSRGVMEKCTYCVQRIRNAEIVAEREQRPIRDGEVVPACVSACPSNAIAFGDLNDVDIDKNGHVTRTSTVGRWKTEPAHYGLLAELNTMPRTTYLADLRNPNPDMPSAKKGA